MFTNYKIDQPFTSNFSVEEGEKNSGCTWKHGAGRTVNVFDAEARKVSGRKTIQSQHCESRFPLFGISIQAGKRNSRPSLKDLARQGLISFTKHKRPISSEGLEVLYAANKLGPNAPESFANSAWFNTILYFRKSNLVPRVSHLTAWCERGETLVGSGHVPYRIWEITIKL